MLWAKAVLIVAAAAGFGVGAASAFERGGGELHAQSLFHDGAERLFIPYRPESVREGAPLVVVLHGGGQDMRIIERQPATKAWLDLADSRGFVVVAPNGTNADGDAAGRNQLWNDLRAPSEEADSDADDVGFILKLIDWAADAYEIDRARVYVTGASNGGMMTYRLLIEAPEAFAGGAAFIANLPVDNPMIVKPKKATPLLIVNGTADPLMPWDGGAIRGGGDRGVVRSAEETKRWWIAALGATATPMTTSLPDRTRDGCRLVQEDYAAQEGGAPFRFIAMEGSGHTLPSASRTRWSERATERLLGASCRDAESAELAWSFWSGETVAASESPSERRGRFRERRRRAD